jgi:hypothetical protein
MLFVSFHDIKRFSLFRSMFEQKTEIEPAGSRQAPQILPPQNESGVNQ